MGKQQKQNSLVRRPGNITMICFRFHNVMFTISVYNCTNSNPKLRTYTVCGLELRMWNICRPKRLKLSFLKLTILRPPLPWYDAPVVHHCRYFSLVLVVKLLSLSSIPQCLKLKIIQQTFKYWHLKTGKTFNHWPTNSGYKSMFSTRTNSI